MKNADIKNLSKEDLQNQLAEAKVNYAKTKIAHKISPLENPILITDLRKSIGRLNTELTNKQ